MQRWLRRKIEADKTSVAPVPSAAQVEPPPLDKLTPDSDFSAFMQPEVDAATRQSALKKLFSAERYRNMDMLDVYVDDYSKPELLPAGMLATLDHVASMLAPAQDAARQPSVAAASAEQSNQPTAETAAKEAAGPAANEVEATRPV